jgi:hypothetical protein
MEHHSVRVAGGFELDRHELRLGGKKRAAQHRRVFAIEYEALNGARTTRTVRPLSINFFVRLAAGCLVRAAE